ncbi:hypothetical protein [Nocardia sp. bgisy118]|uniref:hypothetical protein n=1 Tax=Nocardia sp. bgisy118 TaxID=3413786 RepID=UPI003F4A6D12
MTGMNGGMFSWSAGDMGSAMLESLTDWIAGEERKPGISPGDIQGRFNRQRDDVRGKADDVGFDGAFHPREVLEEDEFEDHDVATLRTKADAIDLTAVGNLITAWQAVGERARESLETFTGAITRLTEEGVWRGASSDAAVAGVRDYATHGAQLPNAAALTSNKLAELKTGLEPTRLLVPYPPDDRSFTDNARSWIAGRGWRSNSEAQDTAKAEALRVLTTVFAPVVRESDTNVPVLPQPYNPVQPGDKPPLTGPGPGPGGPGPGPGGPGPGGTQPEPEPDTPTEDPDSNQTIPSGTDPTSTDPASTNPASTTPASTPTTNPTGLPDRPGPGPGTPGPPGPGGTPGVPSPGSSIRGVPVTATTGAPASAASPATRAAMSGLGGLGAPGARGGRSEEESSKGIPDYLISREHGEELTGLKDLPKVVPPVIGE